MRLKSMYENINTNGEPQELHQTLTTKTNSQLSN